MGLISEGAEEALTWDFMAFKYLNGQGEDFKLTTELSEKVQYSHNKAIENGLNEAILLM